MSGRGKRTSDIEKREITKAYFELNKIEKSRDNVNEINNNPLKIGFEFNEPTEY